ncbi:MAG: Tm-1-like ATP-binding domain-containing protein [Pseudomonadota bacterium]
MATGEPRYRALILATLATKAEEVAFMAARMAQHDVDVETIDLSLEANGKVLGGPAKAQAIDHAAGRVVDQVTQAMDEGVNMVIGLGGGTGAEIALKVLRAMPITFPKMLVTTLPFDPRYALADNSVVLVPTLADLNGLNATLREVLENAAALAAGLCRAKRRADTCVSAPSIAITGLGATDSAVRPLIEALQDQGEETTVFHANGFGGAAFARFAERGAFSALIDLTPHELTRINIAGDHVPMPGRFTAAPEKPRIVLPGGLNFLGLGAKSLVPKRFLERPHYEHSGLFTHVKLTEPEMANMATHLAGALNACTGPRTLIVPMGGFSHHDAPGGAIEDPGLRGVFLDTMRAELSSDVKITELEGHLFDPSVTQAILAELAAFANHNEKVPS